MNETLERVNDYIRNCFYTIKGYFRKTIKILQYIPILWIDEDWDYGYILSLLRYKLDRTRKNFRKNKNHTDYEECSSQIDVVIYAIDRVLLDEYVSNMAWRTASREAFRELIIHNEASIKKDLEIIFDGMKNYIRTWWD